MPYWAHPNNQTLTRSTCRCFLFHARKTPGFGGFWEFYAEFLCTEVRLFLNELDSIIFEFDQSDNLDVVLRKVIKLYSLLFRALQ